EGLFAAVASIPVILCFIGNKSRGALDNASGVASVLLAAEMLSPGVNVGVLITSAEELGLAGARAFAATGREKGIAINCDTIDDSGVFICMTRGVMSPSTAQAVDSAARRVAIRMRRRGMIPGILADNVAFTDAGWESFTVSRGNPGTLARVHTSRDTAANMKGTGLATAARLMAATVEELS
ncbi:MAG: M28 family peptidase, partial [Gemmatimonadales bacterium]